MMKIKKTVFALCAGMMLTAVVPAVANQSLSLKGKCAIGCGVIATTCVAGRYVYNRWLKSDISRAQELFDELSHNADLYVKPGRLHCDWRARVPFMNSEEQRREALAERVSKATCLNDDVKEQLQNMLGHTNYLHVANVRDRLKGLSEKGLADLSPAEQDSDLVMV